ncbi:MULTISPECIES: hypothetical protein [unclassified Brevibacillus]|uniref:hypothetical protein n=1 Tax=unclassified Brevibacillus TaxID=2684853 RepID=UPI00356B2674
MMKEEALQHLHDQVFLPALAERVAAVQLFFHQHQAQLVDEFVESFRQIANRIKVMQDREELAPVGFIHYSMLRTSIMEGTYTYLVEAYTDQWYWEPVECYARYDANWAFQEISSLIRLLDEQRKKYIGVLHTADVEHMVWKRLDCFSQMVTDLIRIAIQEATKLPEYSEINKAKCLRIRVGEFKDFSEDVHIDDGSTRDQIKGAG